jgi:hypothetical protein
MPFLERYLTLAHEKRVTAICSTRASTSNWYFYRTGGVVFTLLDCDAKYTHS